MKRLLVLLICLTALVGCGGGGGVTAPDGSTITINPSTMTVTDAVDVWHTTFFDIIVKNADGQPMGDAKVTISFPWAVPDPQAVVQLYDGSTPKNSPFDAKTDDFGVYHLRFDYRTGFKYNGDLEARSGTTLGKATITVAVE